MKIFGEHRSSKILQNQLRLKGKERLKESRLKERKKERKQIERKKAETRFFKKAVPKKLW